MCGALARKDFFVRYRRATFGVLWAVALPALQAVVLSVILSRVAIIAVPHYSVFIFSGSVAWAYISASVAAGSTSIVDNAALSSKIYFPRAVLPISVCLSNLFAMAISVPILVVVGLIFGVRPGLHSLYLAPATLLALAFAMALTLTLAAAHVYLRDVKYAVQAALMVWFYVTPVFYPLSMLHGVARTVVELNPVTGIVQLFDAGSLADFGFGAGPVLVSVAWTVALAILGLILHSKLDRSFADLL